jgi:hypothetical protein
VTDRRIVAEGLKRIIQKMLRADGSRGNITRIRNWVSTPGEVSLQIWLLCRPLASVVLLGALLAGPRPVSAVGSGCSRFADTLPAASSASAFALLPAGLIDGTATAMTSVQSETLLAAADAGQRRTVCGIVEALLRSNRPGKGRLSFGLQLVFLRSELEAPAAMPAMSLPAGAGNVVTLPSVVSEARPVEQ